jgi:tetratricopeptide (TPR) repeat protein
VIDLAATLRPSATDLGSSAVFARRMSVESGERLVEAQSAIVEGRAGDIVSALEDSLDGLTVASAATWAVLAGAYDQLEASERRDRAYARALELLDGTTGQPIPAEAAALAPALVARDRPADALGLLRAAADQPLTDASIGRLLIQQLEAAGDRSAAAKVCSATAYLAPTDQRVEYIERAIALEPDNVTWQTQLGAAMVVTGDVTAALERLSRVVESVPVEHPANGWFAEALRRSGEADAALARARSVLDEDPNNALALHVSAAAHTDLRHLALALEDVTHLVEVDPDDLGPRRMHVDLLCQLDRGPEALLAAQRVVEDWPSAAEAHAILGHALSATGDDIAALRAFDRSLVINPDDAGTRFARAERLRLMGRLGEARTELERLLDAYPDSPVALGTLGQVFVAEGDPNEAIAFFDRALALSADLTWILGEKAIAQLQLDRTENAVHTLERLIALAPQDLDARVSLGDALVELGQPGLAITVAEGVIADDDAHASAHRLRGAALLAQNLFAESVAAFGQAISHADGRANDPDLASVRILRGDAHAGMGMWTEAGEDYAAALVTLKPDDPRVSAVRYVLGRSRYMRGELADAEIDCAEAAEAARAAGDATIEEEALSLLGELHRLKGSLDEALTSLDRALELQPRAAFALATKGQVLASLGRQDEATKALTAALEIDPDLSWARAALAEAFRLQGDYVSALDELDKVATDGRELAWLRGTRGQVLAALGRQEEALAELRAAWALEQSPWIADELSSSLGRTGRPADLDDAIEILDQAVAQNPGARALLANKADMLRLAGRASEALAVADQYLTESPGDARALGTRVHALVDLGSYEAAEQDARKLIELNPTDNFARVGRARALAGVNRLIEALTELEAVLHTDPDDPNGIPMKLAILVSLGRWETTIAAARPVLEHDPASVIANGALGAASRRLDRLEDAIAYLRRAVEGGSDIGWRTELADALAEQGSLTEARAIREELVREVRSNRPSDPDSIACAGWAALWLDQVETAIEWLGEATLLDPGQINSRFLLAFALLVADRGELAVDEYEGSIDLALSSPDGERGTTLVREALRDLRLWRKAVPPSARDAAHRVETALAEALQRVDGNGTESAVSQTEHR